MTSGYLPSTIGVSSDMLERRTTAFRSPGAEARPTPSACVSALDQDLLGVVLRFLRAVKDTADRRVLAPLYLQEMVYRVLQRDQYARLLALAAAESASNPVSAVLEYMRAHLSDPLTVADLADLVSLSPSAFAHLFRDITGRSPYQFLKEMRLDRARPWRSWSSTTRYAPSGWWTRRSGDRPARSPRSPGPPWTTTPRWSTASSPTGSSWRSGSSTSSCTPSSSTG